jgi:hypothetical protein
MPAQVDHDNKIAVACWRNPGLAMITLVCSQATKTGQLGASEATLDSKGAHADHSSILA